ncbi:uncharacterized protein L203_100237 [Cryptococcus depauperatus CBS 7841]|uniref:Uncharacterized protein n=1 Tax=Cryptococcus depauperatus CBS 7841 TaxID=1295531 RepID=A0A1E3IZU9_9TREE|nr:hypothetical protein L203_00103 [Cryptococcus depauperatus CBS 7841]
MNFKSLFATLAVLATTVLGADLTVNSPPSLVVCQPAQLAWTGGQGPYIIAVIPGGQPSAAALETLSDSANGNSITWKVDIAAGTSVTLKVTDSTGNIQYSSPVTIQEGSDTSCVGKGGNTSSNNSTSPAGGNSTASGGTTPSSATSAASSAVTSGASSGSKAASSASSGAHSAASSGASASNTGRPSSATPLSVQLPAVALALAGGIAALL